MGSPAQDPMGGRDRTGSYPLNAAVPREHLNEARPPCFWWWCQGVWRFDISEDALNYPDEALWLTLWAVDPTSCQDLCFDG